MYNHMFFWINNCCMCLRLTFLQMVRSWREVWGPRVSRNAPAQKKTN